MYPMMGIIWDIFHGSKNDLRVGWRGCENWHLMELKQENIERGLDGW
jgi:hypothetical protein